MLVEQVTGAC